MFRGKKNQAQEGRLDEVGRQILRASAMTDGEADEAASSPFLLARVRARIAAEKGVRERAPNDWLSIIPAFRRAVPVMILIALSAVGVSWYLQAGAPVEQSNQSVGLYPDPHGPQMSVVSACAISTKEECAISTEEVLATLVNQERQEAQ
ncbi:MAG TPA: hypothetical protein VE262_02390 [Blastocatellia bacterium]|nr:hypothetical protein [Blastocatellia bacterium]